MAGSGVSNKYTTGTQFQSGNGLLNEGYENVILQIVYHIMKKSVLNGFSMTPVETKICVVISPHSHYSQSKPQIKNYKKEPFIYKCVVERKN